jgi:hypothetical protein
LHHELQHIELLLGQADAIGPRDPDLVLFRLSGRSDFERRCALTVDGLLH